MANSPSVVLASLSDDQLKKSIDSLVTHVDEAMKKMVQSTNNAVGEMEAKLKSLGNLKIDTGGSNDGGTGRRTQQHEKLTKAVNDASEAVSKETQKLQDLQQSLSGASDREQNFVSQKERAANIIAQENELLSKQQSELAALKAQEQQLADAHQKDMQARQQNATAIEKQRGAVKYYEEELNSLQAKLASAQAKEDRYWSVVLKARETISKSFSSYSNDKYGFGFEQYEHGKSVFYKTERDVRSLIDALSKLKETNVRHGFLDEIKRPYAEMMQPSRDTGEFFKRFQEEISIQIKSLQETKKGLRGDARKDVDDKITAAKELLAVYKTLSSAQDSLNKTYSKENLLGASNVSSIKKDIEETKVAYDGAKQKLDQLTQATKQSDQIRQESLNLDAKIQEKEKEISETRGRIATATREQSEAEKNASQAAREKANIQSQVANQEKQVAEAKKQLTTATQQQAEVEKQSVQNVVQQTAARDKQIKKNQEAAMSFDQIASALDKARRTVSDFNTKRASGILPSSEDYKRYEQALARIVEYNDKLKQSALSRADANQWANVFDARRNTKDLFSTDERLKQLNKYYAEQEKLSQKAIQDEERQRQRRVAAMEKESAAQKKMIDDQYKLSFARTMKIPTDQLDLAQAKLERLQALLRDMRERGILSNSQIASTEAEIRKLSQMIGQVGQTQQQTTQSAQRYTEEIRKQAQAIRESQQWKEKGFVTINGVDIYNLENSTKRRISLEEQLVALLQEEKTATSQVAQEQLNVAKNAAATNEQLEKARALSNKGIGTAIGERNGSIPTFTTQLESANVLSKRLKELKEQYNSLSYGKRLGAEGQAIAQQIREITRQGQKLNNELNRPTKKEVFGLPQKTLDDIAYKMRQLASYRSGLNVETQVKEIEQVNKKYSQLQKTMNDIMQKNTDMIASNTALGRSWNYMKSRLAFYFTVGASTSFIKNLIDIRGQYELLERSIGILIDSAQNGSQIFAELNAMAIKSPFTTMELGAAAKQLVAYDVAAKDVVETTKRIGDMAAAVGIPLERLTYALGQIKAYGYLNARDARMFANAGIPLVKELADYYTELEGRLVSTADVYDRIKKKAIDYSDVMSVVNKMTDEGGKFFDFQEKAADTLKVRIANLTLAWNNMLNEMGKDNQGILTEGLKVTKQIFESWRDINNMVIALGLTYGTIKAAQIAYYLWVMRTEKAVGAWSKIINAIDYALNAKIANAINSLKTSLVGFFTNPTAMLAVAFTALSVALTKAYLDYRDLQAANEEFNKSVVKNAEENVKSIDKFFGDYKKQLESVGSLNSADQTKLWERVQEEIEKTTKNAEKYIEILNKIPEVSKRIEVGESVLEQSKRIQDELKYMAERGMFNVGGGFANDSAAKDLQQYSDAVNELITKYGDLDNAKKEALKVNEITLESGEIVRQYTGEYADFQRKQIEAEKELQNIVLTLDKVNMAEILGTGDMETQLANVRSFAIAWRDAFLATEKGSKISAEGQALLNSYIDKWIEQQARVNHLIKDENTAAVEANRTAWETFFKFLNTEERKRLDVAIKTNQLGSKSVQELWDNAAERMQEKATTSYNLIQQQIADLRNTPDIVINVVYRNNKEKLEKDQEEFEKKFIQPKNWGALSTDEYLKQEKANREKYGTLMRKQGEDTAEYEKRISDERKSQLELQKKNGDIIEENKNKTDDYSRAVTEQAKKEKQAADDRLKVIKDVEDAGGYDFSTKSERAAANKAAKQAESELAKALKEELSTIDKVRSIYKDLTKEGMSHANAVERATRGWDETVNAINRVLQKNGLQKLDLSKFAGIENPRELVNMLQSQLNTLLKRGAKPVEIKELQTKINTLEVDADKYDLTKITKRLNNELDRLKEEYGLAVELDANPEMGNLFADWMGFDMSALPHTAEECAKRMTKALNKYLADEKSGIEIGDLLALTDDDLRMFQQRVDNKELTQVWVDNIVKNTKEARNALKKENSNITKEWDSLIQKYAEYEYKIAQVQRNANKERKAFALKYGTNDQKERALVLTTEIDAEEDQAKKQELINQLKQLLVEIAGDDDSKLKIPATINKKELEESAKISFEEFQKSPEWIVATGDLAGMTNKAIGGLIGSIESYKKKAKNLDPKQIKNINNALRKLYKQQREGNPFSAISNAIDQAKARMEDIQPALDDVMDDIIKLEEEIGDTKPTEEQAKTLDKLKKKWKELYEVGQISASDIVSGINSAIDVAVKASDSFNKMAEALGGTNMTKAAKTISDITGNLQAAGQGAAAGAQLGGGWGAAIGATVGGLTDLVTRFAEQWSGNKSQTERVKEVEESVGKLELAYIDLEHAVDKAMGTAVIGAKQAALANKQAQLESIKRQLELEKERDSKYRDSEKILSLEKQYKSLFNEIKSGINDISNNMLGISSISDAAESLVGSMIDAFKRGENYMEVYSNSFEDMIDNMVMKAVVGKIIGERIEQMFEYVGAISKKRADSQRYGVVNDLGQVVEMSYDEAVNKLMSLINSDSISNELKENYSKQLERINKEYSKNATPSPDDIRESREMWESWKDADKEAFDAWMEAYGIKYGQDATDTKLSALQQGIQGITEDTAGALEATTNGISQQSYLQSDLLTQIRDAVVSMDMDVSLGVMSQILLQLQSSYQIQQSMLLTMENWTNPSGNAVRVELIS